MNIIFDWLPQINRSLRESAEIKIKNDIQESDDIKPCHTGPISVSILSSDPLEGSIKGEIGVVAAKFLRYSMAQAMDPL